VARHDLYYGSYGTSYGTDRAHSDSYGTYYYDRLGYRTYTRCRDRSARPRDQCRDYIRNTYTNYGSNREYYNSYDGDRDYYSGLHDHISVGQGSLRYINGRRDVEMTCEFPRGNHIVSNIVWERVKDRNYYGRSRSLRDWFGWRMEVERLGDYGSVLIIRDYEERDAGVYRCVGTRTYDQYRSSYRRGYDRTETVYMEVQFYPTDYDSYSSAFSGRDYYPSGRYRPSYRYRTSAVSTSEDSIVADNEVGEIDVKAVE